MQCRFLFFSVSEFFVYFGNKHDKFFVYCCESKHRGVFQGTIYGAFLFPFREKKKNQPFRPILFLLMPCPLYFRLEASRRSRFSNSPFGISGLLLLGSGFNNSSVSPMLASFVYMFSFHQSTFFFLSFSGGWGQNKAEAHHFVTFRTSCSY